MSNFLNFIKRRGDVYVDRGDPANWDKTVGDFTTDEVWHDLDLSAIVPSGASLIHISFSLKDDAAESYLTFRKKGNSNIYNMISGYTQEANVYISATGFCPCDSNRVIQYLGKNTAFTTINFVVLGWIMPGDVNDALKTDGTGGRVLRASYVYLSDGTNDNTIKCDLGSRFNGDSITETDNIVKDATTGHFTLTADGKQLSIENAGLSGLVLWAGQVGYQNTTGNDISCRIYKSADNIKIVFFNATTGTTWDITSLVDTGALVVEIQYITDA